MPDFTASPLVDATEESVQPAGKTGRGGQHRSAAADRSFQRQSGSTTPPEVIDSLQSAIHRRENHGYPSFWGKPQVREAIARFYRRQYDVELDPHSEVAVFQGRISV